MRRDPLADFILERLRDRGESPDHFAQRVGVNGSGMSRFYRGITRTLHDDTKEKIALGLGMTVEEMMVLAHGQVAYEESPQRAAVMARTSELVEILNYLPQTKWEALLRFTMQHTREAARLLVSAGAEDTTFSDGEDTTRSGTANSPSRGLGKEITPFHPFAA